MTALGFWARISSDGALPVPDDVAARIQEEQPVRVIALLTGPSEDDDTWSRMTVDRFLNGFAKSDAIYDAVSAR